MNTTDYNVNKIEITPSKIKTPALGEYVWMFELPASYPKAGNATATVGSSLFFTRERYRIGASVGQYMKSYPTMELSAYSHWKSSLLFSTSENINKGRKYEICYDPGRADECIPFTNRAFFPILDSLKDKLDTQNISQYQPRSKHSCDNRLAFAKCQN